MVDIPEQGCLSSNKKELYSLKKSQNTYVLTSLVESTDILEDCIFSAKLFTAGEFTISSPYSQVVTYKFNPVQGRWSLSTSPLPVHESQPNSFSYTFDLELADNLSVAGQEFILTFTQDRIQKDQLLPPNSNLYSDYTSSAFSVDGVCYGPDQLVGVLTRQKSDSQQYLLVIDSKLTTFTVSCNFNIKTDYPVTKVLVARPLNENNYNIVSRTGSSELSSLHYTNLFYTHVVGQGLYVEYGVNVYGLTGQVCVEFTGVAMSPEILEIMENIYPEDLYRSVAIQYSAVTKSIQIAFEVSDNNSNTVLKNRVPIFITQLLSNGSPVQAGLCNSPHRVSLLAPDEFMNSGIFNTNSAIKISNKLTSNNDPTKVFENSVLEIEFTNVDFRHFHTLSFATPYIFKKTTTHASNNQVMYVWSSEDTKGFVGTASFHDNIVTLNIEPHSRGVLSTTCTIYPIVESDPNIVSTKYNTDPEVFINGFKVLRNIQVEFTPITLVDHTAIVPTQYTRSTSTSVEAVVTGNSAVRNAVTVTLKSFTPTYEDDALSTIYFKFNKSNIKVINAVTDSTWGYVYSVDHSEDVAKLTIRVDKTYVLANINDMSMIFVFILDIGDNVDFTISYGDKLDQFTSTSDVVSFYKQPTIQVLDDTITLNSIYDIKSITLYHDDWFSITSNSVTIISSDNSIQPSDILHHNRYTIYVFPFSLTRRTEELSLSFVFKSDFAKPITDYIVLQDVYRSTDFNLDPFVLADKLPYVWISNEMRNNGEFTYIPAINSGALSIMDVWSGTVPLPSHFELKISNNKKALVFIPFTGPGSEKQTISLPTMPYIGPITYTIEKQNQLISIKCKSLDFTQINSVKTYSLVDPPTSDLSEEHNKVVLEVSSFIFTKDVTLIINYSELSVDSADESIKCDYPVFDDTQLGYMNDYDIKQISITVLADEASSIYNQFHVKCTFTPLTALQVEKVSTPYSNAIYLSLTSTTPTTTLQSYKSTAFPVVPLTSSSVIESVVTVKDTPSTGLSPTEVEDILNGYKDAVSDSTGGGIQPDDVNVGNIENVPNTEGGFDTNIDIIISDNGSDLDLDIFDDINDKFVEKVSDKWEVSVAPPSKKEQVGCPANQCGGSKCPRCGLGKTCKVNSDCLSTVCDEKESVCVTYKPDEPTKPDDGEDGDNSAIATRFDLVKTLVMCSCLIILVLII